MANITNNDIYKAIVGIQNDMRDMKTELNNKIDAVEERLNKKVKDTANDLKKYINKEWRINCSL